MLSKVTILTGSSIEERPDMDLSYALTSVAMVTVPGCCSAYRIQPNQESHLRHVFELDPLRLGMESNTNP